MSDNQGTLTLEIFVDKFFYEEDGTHIRLKLGHSCYASFLVPARVMVPPYITFKAQLDLKPEEEQ